MFSLCAIRETICFRVCVCGDVPCARPRISRPDALTNMTVRCLCRFFLNALVFPLVSTLFRPLLIRRLTARGANFTDEGVICRLFYLTQSGSRLHVSHCGVCLWLVDDFFSRCCGGFLDRFTCLLVFRKLCFSLFVSVFVCLCLETDPSFAKRRKKKHGRLRHC